jgi:hypothetical protein
LKPLTLEDEEVIDELLRDLPDDACQFELWYENEHVGVGRYRLYVLPE